MKNNGGPITMGFVAGIIPRLGMKEKEAVEKARVQASWRQLR